MKPSCWYSRRGAGEASDSTRSLQNMGINCRQLEISYLGKANTYWPHGQQRDSSWSSRKTKGTNTKHQDWDSAPMLSTQQGLHPTSPGGNNKVEMLERAKLPSSEVWCSEHWDLGHTYNCGMFVFTGGWGRVELSYLHFRSYALLRDGLLFLCFREAGDMLPHVCK